MTSNTSAFNPKKTSWTHSLHWNHLHWNETMFRNEANLREE